MEQLSINGKEVRRIAHRDGQIYQEQPMPRIVPAILRKPHIIEEGQEIHLMVRPVMRLAIV